MPRPLFVLLVAAASCAADMILSRTLQASVFFCGSASPACSLLGPQQAVLELLQLPGSHLSSYFLKGPLAELSATTWWWLDGLCWGLAGLGVGLVASRRLTR